jgi:alpha-mannosidase
MDFTIGRIQRLLKDLAQWMHTDSMSISRWKIKKSAQKRLYMEDTSDWTDFDAPGPWSGFREKYWFVQTVVLPPSFAGKPVEFHLTTGAEGGWDLNNPQFYFYLDGRLTQGLDINHRTARITGCAVPGERHVLAIHGYTSDNAGFLRFDAVLRAVSERVRALYYDILTPLQVAMQLEENDDRRIRLLGCLNDAANLLDMREMGSEAFLAGVDKAAALLRDSLYAGGHSEEARVACVGHSHIDVAWLWTLDVTREKVARTFSSMLALMERYPAFIFSASQPQNYLFVKQDEPALYDRIKKAVRDGRWDPAGAMFLEADCNLPTGESLARQLLYGKRFFQSEFGVDSRTLWLPDVFGYSAALPQLLKKSGVPYFMTTKISWNEFNKFPYDTFRWQGIDGSEVLAHFIPAMEYQDVETRFTTTYNGILSPSQVMGAWRRYQQKQLNSEVLFAAGYGDGGGGPNEEMLEHQIRMAQGLPGCPKVAYTTVDGFFDRLAHDVNGKPELPRWVGELYFEYHRGTYTSMAKNKKYNRQAEFLLMNREKAQTLLQLAGGAAYPKGPLDEAWQVVMLNQFHDIIPGSSIKEVYEESERQYETLFAHNRPALKGALMALAQRAMLPGDALIAFNGSGLTVDAPVVFEPLDGAVQPRSVYAAETPDVRLPVQRTWDGSMIFYARGIPANGYRAFYVSDAEPTVKEPISIDASRVETALMRVSIDPRGRVASVYDIRAERELLSGPANVLEVYEDRPHNWDAWDINDYHKKKRYELDGQPEIELIESGPVRGVIRVRHKYLNSIVEQRLCFYPNTARIDIQNDIEWKQQHLLLKAAFPVDVFADEATYDIQFGNLKRPTHFNTSWDAAQFEVCAHKWADLSEPDYGVSLLNDCKYGHDIHEGVIRLTLLKCSTYPNPEADQGHHAFTYSLYPHSGDWREAGTVSHAYALNNPPVALFERAHAGPLPDKLSLLKTDAPNAIIEAVKRAEDSDALICRVYECFGQRTRIRLDGCAPILSAFECDLLENPDRALCVEGGALHLELLPYEVKTVQLDMRAGDAAITS